MRTPKHYLAALLMAGALAAPLVVAEGPQGQRYYDKTHKDYHQWDANEEKSYGVFLNENHIKVHTFSKAKPSEQQRYWKWRHDHPDGR